MSRRREEHDLQRVLALSLKDSALEMHGLRRSPRRAETRAPNGMQSQCMYRIQRAHASCT